MVLRARDKSGIDPTDGSTEGLWTKRQRGTMVLAPFLILAGSSCGDPYADRMVLGNFGVVALPSVTHN